MNEINTGKEEKIAALIAAAENELAGSFRVADEISEFNQAKVLDAFAENGVALRHFNPSSGYGYGDEGRHVLGKVYAKAFGAEAGIVSPALLSGTHTLAVALFGVLRPGDRVLSVTGLPYDTIRGVIYGEGNGSLKDFGVEFSLLDMTPQGKVDYSALENVLQKEKVREEAGEKPLKMIYIQRSRGYELRDPLSVAEIGEICSFVRKHGFNGCIFVDNCYGEFVEKQEPCDVGADIAAGSLIKNPGGGACAYGRLYRRREKIYRNGGQPTHRAVDRRRSGIVRLRLQIVLSRIFLCSARGESGGERQPSHRKMYGAAGV